MVYKKYIKKGGKVYGPYYYHSRRVNGKVVSEYRGGEEEETNYKKYALIGVGVFFFVLIVYTLFNFEFSGVSGHVVMDLGATYREGEALQGQLDLFLNQGELIPSSSKVIFETNTQTYEYTLQDIVTDSTVEGDYYVSEKDISGSGLGFGEAGVHSVYPIVYFNLEIYSSSEEEPIVEENSSNESFEPAPGLPDAISNFFLALTPTGQVTIELESSNQGQVSYENQFVLDLLEAQTAEIVPGSVYSDVGELPDNTIQLSIEGNQAIVITSYSEESQGFGADYLEEDTKKLSINLDELNMVFDKGSLKVSVVYDQTEIVYLTTILGEGQVDAQQEEGTTTSEETTTVQEPTSTPTPVPAPEPIQPIVEEPTIKGLPPGLSDTEKAILLNKFGETSIKSTKAKLVNNKIIIRYELGDYWFEAAYDAALSKEELAEQRAADVTRWIQDILKSISKQKPVEEDLEELLGNYSI